MGFIDTPIRTDNMKALILTTAIVALAPMAAFAQSCSWDTYWSASQQACVSFTEMTAETVQDAGQGWWIQPYTDATATYIREYESCDGCVSQR